VNENYPPFIRNRLPRWDRPEVDLIEGLSPVVVIDQKRLGGNARSTVGTITDAYTYLRLLFSRISDPFVGESTHFSFNDPSGMCPTCTGLGETLTPDVTKLVDEELSLAAGAILMPGFSEGKYWLRRYLGYEQFDGDKPLRDWGKREREALLFGGEAAKRLGLPKDYESVVELF
ncbi:excinuclease ABC subunit UvrA, partial [Nocardia gipuzkoensis]